MLCAGDSWRDISFGHRCVIFSPKAGVFNDGYSGPHPSDLSEYLTQSDKPDGESKHGDSEQLR